MTTEPLTQRDLSEIRRRAVWAEGFAQIPGDVNRLLAENERLAGQLTAAWLFLDNLRMDLTVLSKATPAESADVARTLTGRVEAIAVLLHQQGTPGHK